MGSAAAGDAAGMHHGHSIRMYPGGVDAQMQQVVPRESTNISAKGLVSRTAIIFQDWFCFAYQEEFGRLGLQEFRRWVEEGVCCI